MNKWFPAIAGAVLVMGCLTSCSSIPRRGLLLDTARSGGRYEVKDVNYDRGAGQAMVGVCDVSGSTGTNIVYRWYSYDGSTWREMPMVGAQRPANLTPAPGAVSPTNAPAQAVFRPAANP